MVMTCVRKFYGPLLCSVGDGEITYEHKAGHYRPLMLLRLWNYQVSCVMGTLAQAEESSVIAYSLLLLTV